MTKTEKRLKNQKDKAIAKSNALNRELTDDEALDLSYAGEPTLADLFFGKEELIQEQKQLFRKRKVNRLEQAIFFRFQDKILGKYGGLRIKLSKLDNDELLELSGILPSVKLSNLQNEIVEELHQRLTNVKS